MPYGAQTKGKRERAEGTHIMTISSIYSDTLYVNVYIIKRAALYVALTQRVAHDVDLSTINCDICHKWGLSHIPQTRHCAVLWQYGYRYTQAPNPTVTVWYPGRYCSNQCYERYSFTIPQNAY